MVRRAVPVFAVASLLFMLSCAEAHAAAAPAAQGAGEYSRHFLALTQLTIAVAEAMPAQKFGFRPHPESMDFGQLISHIATTNYQFCAGLKDTETPALPTPTGKDAILKFLIDSFQYCSVAINSVTEEELKANHNSPDGNLPGRDVLLAMYVHVAHHRGQAEIYLRDNGIKPPPYRV